jgi:hypothetical protein
MIGAGVAVAVVGVGLAATRGRESRAFPRPSESTVLVVLLAVAAPVGAAIYSLFGNSVFLPRNLIGSWPGLALAVGLLLASARGVLRICALGLVLGGFAVGAAQLLESGHQRTDYDGAAAYVDRVANPADPILEGPDLTPVSLTGFDVALATAPGGSDHTHVLPATQPPEALARRVSRLAAGARPLFLVVPGSSSSIGVLRRFSPGSRLLHALQPRFRFTHSRAFSGYPPLSVYVFRPRPDATGG